MRIRSIQVNNFKSLVGFNLELARFSCLIGLNGVGKSTVLQFIDFLAQLVRGDMKGWLEERRWQPKDVSTRVYFSSIIDIRVQFYDAEEQPAGRWWAKYKPGENRCTWERIHMENFVLEVRNEVVRLSQPNELISNAEDWKTSINFTYEGSILSALKENLLPPSILRLKEFFVASESLDMLSPEHLRQKTRNAKGTLGHGGRNLSAFLYDLGKEGQSELTEKLVQVYPQLREIYVKALRSGWKELHALEVFGDRRLWTEARHMNDGLLRLLAILSEIASSHTLLLFDEIENGINPEVVEFVLDALVQAKQQVLVTTHSPMILNFLEDETARNGVVYLYKTPEGFTKSIPFFSIPSLRKKLTVMGPGEAYVDTNLSELPMEIAEMSKGDE